MTTHTDRTMKDRRTWSFMVIDFKNLRNRNMVYYSSLIETFAGQEGGSWLTNNIKNNTVLANLDKLNIVTTERWFRYNMDITEIDFEKMGLTAIDSLKVGTMGRMFEDCDFLRQITFGSFDTSNVENMQALFMGCRSLKKVDLNRLNTSSVVYMPRMFDDCGLEEIDLSGFDTHNVRDMSAMFELTRAEQINLSSFDTSNVNNMYCMFAYSCVKRLDLSNFDTRKVTNFSNMFTGCDELEYLDISNFCISKNSNHSKMFSGCDSLEDIKLPKDRETRKIVLIELDALKQELDNRKPYFT